MHISANRHAEILDIEAKNAANFYRQVSFFEDYSILVYTYYTQDAPDMDAGNDNFYYKTYVIWTDFTTGFVYTTVYTKSQVFELNHTIHI